LSDLDALEFREKSGKLTALGKDVLGNEFQYTFGVEVDPGFSGKYDTNLVKVLNKITKCRSDSSLSMLVSDLLIGVTLKDDKSVVTLAVTARRD
jgi:hypothetical protein